MRTGLVATSALLVLVAGAACMGTDHGAAHVHDGTHDAHTLAGDAHSHGEDAHTHESPDTGGGIDFSVTVRRYVAATKRRVARCRPGPVEPNYYAELEQDLLQSIAAPGVSEQAIAKFAQCAHELGAAGCGAEPEVCAGDEPGLFGQGAGCLLDAQCASGRCSGATTQGCGTCDAARNVGSECSDGSPCGKGLECAPQAGGGAVCVRRRIAALGEPCGGGTLCATSLRCNQSALPAAACEELVALGGSCADGHACDDGGTVYCNSSFTCVQRPVAANPCADVTCASGFVCDDATRQCRAGLTDGALNSLCQAGDACAAGLACSRGTSTMTGVPRRCVAQAQAGQDCTTPLCASGLVCEGLGGGQPQCVDPKQPADCR